MTQWSLKDAKEHFEDVATAAEQAPQTVTRKGKSAVVVVDAEQFARLEGRAAEPKKVFKNGREYTFVDHLLAIPKGGPDDLFERHDVTHRDIDF